MATQSLPYLEDVFKYNTYLFDADGVLWRSMQPVNGAIQFIDLLLEKGKQVFIVTNNSTKSTAAYMEKVQQLGFAHLGENNIISPNVVMKNFFEKNPKYVSKAVYTIGSAGVVETLNEMGVKTIGTGPDVVPSGATFLTSIDVSTEVSAVIAGFDVHISYAKIMKAANYLHNPECGFFITNEDYTFPTDQGSLIVPGTGCITAAIRASTHPREPVCFGKPSKQLEQYLRETIGSLDASSAIIFGDRLDTDIKFGNQLGIDTCWMDTGVHTRDDVARAMRSEQERELVPHFTFSFAPFATTKAELN